MTQDSIQPATGDAVQLTKCGRNGIIIDVSSKTSKTLYGIAVATLDAKTATFWLRLDQFTVTAPARTNLPKFTSGQTVIVNINGKEWSGRIAPSSDHLTGEYVVDLLVAFAEDDIKPYIQINPGH